MYRFRTWAAPIVEIKIWFSTCWKRGIKLVSLLEIPGMLKNYWKTAWRHITRHRTYAAINIFGLALGLTCCLFILLWVRDEQAMDNFHTGGQRLYIAYTSVSSNGRIDGSYNTPVYYDYANKKRVFVLQDAASEIAGVRDVVLYEKGYVLPWGHPESFQWRDKIIRMSGSRATADFFNVFSFPLIEGRPETALADLHSIAISRKMAEVFFGSPGKAIGQTLRYENRLNFSVTAVFENIAAQSSLQFDFLLPWAAQETGLLEYASGNFDTYLRLADNADPVSVAAGLNRLARSRMEEPKGVTEQIGLQHFGDRYLHDTFVNGEPVTGRITYVRLFSGIAVFILLIACVNFMNLATARSVSRAREVGLRKVVGSTRGPLITQFLGEAMVFAFLSFLLSLVIVVSLLPVFNTFTGKQMGIPFFRPFFWISSLTLVVVTGAIAGSYPALYLSSLKPIRILKGVVRFSPGAIRFRQSLTVFQFVLSIVLIIATLVITRQVSYVQQARLGYDRENLIYVRIDGGLIREKNYLLFKQLASRLPGIEMVDRCTEAIQNMEFVVSDTSIRWEGKGPNDEVGVKPASVGYDFVRLMKMDVVKGRDFSRNVTTDSADAFMVNEEAVREMGLNDPIGKWVSAWKKKGHIVGVLKDFHTGSLRERILPILFDVKEYEDFGLIITRTKPGQTREALASLEKVYKAVNPGYAFSYQFVDEEYRRLYRSETIISGLTVCFAALAIVISCLGLLVLAMLAAKQRIREIGIRRVLGASIEQIVGMFSRDFLGLVLVAFLIAAPLAWYAMQRWLADFAYRIDMAWWIFGLAGFSAALLAWLTVGWQAVQAAIANPAKSLRTD